MKYNRDRAHCCGSILALIGEPPGAYELGNIRLREGRDTGAETSFFSFPLLPVLVAWS